MVFSICKEVLPYYANLPGVSDSSGIMAKEELACWVYLFAQSNQLGQGAVSLKNIAEAFGYSSASANTPKILTSIRDALIGMVQKAKGETSAEFDMDADDVKAAKPTQKIKYTVKTYQSSRQKPFIQIPSQDVEELLLVCRGSKIKLPELINLYTAILGNLITLKNGIGHWLWSTYLMSICGVCEATFLKYRRALVAQNLIYIQCQQDHPTYYAKTDTPELWQEIEMLEHKNRRKGMAAARQSDKTDMEEKKHEFGKAD